jgi:hypothetical protein
MNSIDRFPPDAVRVWRGFQRADLTDDGFCDRLGSVFMPATVEFQVAVGLNVYSPTVTRGLAGKPDTVPDETAIVFWDSQDVYHAAFNTLASRAYTLLHSVVFTSESRADFPVAFAGGSLDLGQPVYVSATNADWMHGTIHHLVGSRPADSSPTDFLAAVQAAIRDGSHPPEHAILCVGDNYLTYWQWQSSDDSLDKAPLEALGACLDWRHVFTPQPTELEGSLWDEWPGVAVTPGSSFNFQFKRRWEERT